MVEELERDADKLNKQMKKIDDNLKQEMKKNQQSMLDSGGVRR